MFGKGEITSIYKGGCHEKEKKFVKEVFFCGGVITLRTESKNIIFLFTWGWEVIEFLKKFYYIA